MEAPHERPTFLVRLMAALVVTAVVFAIAYDCA